MIHPALKEWEMACTEGEIGIRGIRKLINMNPLPTIQGQKGDFLSC
jgi:hypothetical protein